MFLENNFNEAEQSSLQLPMKTIDSFIRKGKSGHSFNYFAFNNMVASKEFLIYLRSFCNNIYSVREGSEHTLDAKTFF